MSDITVKYAELFVGVGGFRKGIEQSGILSECVYANELDKHASAVYRYWWGAEDFIEGDIREQNTEYIPDIDFLTAGFPCQSFSVAGKRLGMADTRGTLFFEVARVLADKRPRHFLLENVKGLLSHDDGKTFQTILGVLADIGYRVEWQVLNSTCWVPQNRERVFVVGHLRGECGCQVFPLREEDGGEMLPCLTSTDWKGPSKQRAGLIVPVMATGGALRTRDNPRGWHLEEGKEGVANSLTSVEKDSMLIILNRKPYDRYGEGDVPTAISQGTGRFRNSTCSVVGIPVLQKTAGYTVTVKDNETGCLQAGGMNVRDKVPNVAVPDNGKWKQHQQDRIVDPETEDCPTLCSVGDGHAGGGDAGHLKVAMPDACMSLDCDGYLRLTGARPRDENGKPQLLPIGYRRFRRLTPIECERLQGFPDGHTFFGSYLTNTLPKSKRSLGEYTVVPVSDTQRYRMMGNAVTTLVIQEVIKKIMAVGCFSG